MIKFIIKLCNLIQKKVSPNFVSSGLQFPYCPLVNWASMRTETETTDVRGAGAPAS